MKLEELYKSAADNDLLMMERDPRYMHQHFREMGLKSENFYQELEMSSRYVDPHQDISYGQTPISLHSHTYYEILYCRDAAEVEYLVGAERYRLQKGDVIIVPPGISHRPMVAQHMAQPYIRDVMWVSQELIDQFAMYSEGHGEFPLSVPHLLRTAETRWEFVGEMFRNGVREAERREAGWEAVVLGNAIQLLTYLIRAIRDRSSKALRAEKPELLDEILAYVETHLAEKLTLGDVAKHFWVSQSTITQTFRNKMGVSFYRLVTQRRLIAAKLLILDGGPLEDVGRQVGFTDYSTFYRAFKQEFGISPRQFRKKLDSNEQ